MEKIPACYAMEWSIELEKGLRSKKPGNPLEAVKQIGYKLQCWTAEPSLTKEISNMYDMVPGEDILFANTILLRLADAFCNGDIEIRRCILKVFLLELRHIIKKGRLYNGIMARKRVPNHSELLKRLKVVYDTGDLEAKSLTLRLFGCWADIAKDSTHIHFLVLSSMQSNHELEVKASLFAAGCISRLSEGFAYIVLKILISIISSIAKSHDVRLAATRTLANLQCTSAVRNKAYQAGREVLLGLSMDDIKVEMLLSLSKLACHTSLLFPEQLNLLQSFLSHEYPIPLKDRALRCLYILLGGSSCHCFVSTSVAVSLFSIFENDEFPLKLQCLALQILKKIFSYRLLSPAILDIADLLKVVVIIKNVDTPKLKRELSLTFLLDILCSMKEASKAHSFFFANQVSDTMQPQGTSRGTSPSTSMTSSGCNPAKLVSNVFLLIMDQVNILVMEIIKLICTENMKSCSESIALKKEMKLMFYFALRLARVDPSSALVAISRLKCIVHFLVNKLNDGNDEVYRGSTELPSESDAEIKSSISAHLLYLCRFANACMDILLETSSISSEVLYTLKDIVNCIKHCRYSCYDSLDVFRLIIHSVSMCCDFKEGGEKKVTDSDEICCNYNTCWLHQEYLALDFTKKVLKKERFWEVYKAGKYFCLRGLWFAATFSFRKLIDVANSRYYSHWFKALMLFVGSESEIKLLLFPKVSLELINCFHSASDTDQPFSYNMEANLGIGNDYDWIAYKENLSRVCSRICSSEKALEALGNVSGNFFFQRFFLNLRRKVLELVVETLGILSSNTRTVDKHKVSSSSNHGNATIYIKELHPLLFALDRVSLKFNNVAKSYNLLATSFMDMDAGSLVSISRLGVTCSTLAFCTSLATSVVSSPAFRNIMSPSTDNFEFFSSIKVVQDLAERMWDIDRTMARKLMQFISVNDGIWPGLCSISNMHCPILFNDSSLSHVKSAITDILSVQTDLEVTEDVDDLITNFERGLQHLGYFIRQFMAMQLVTPKYFFRVRPCLGSEIFIFHANSAQRDELFVKPGHQLPLSLCIQLRNASSLKCASIDKIYCVLAVNASECMVTGNRRRLAPAQCNLYAHRLDEMIWLSEILMMHLRTISTETDGEHHHVVDNCNLLTTCVSFEPNKMGMGFSTCLLNVSHLPEGSYPIKWHGSCVDDRGFYWNLIPSNNGSVLTIKA